MLGYVVIDKPELKIKDYERYRSFYCGLCRTLKEKYGKWAQLTLSYDMTFLYILLNALYEPALNQEKHGCVTHPFGKHDMLISEAAEYAADMGILLGYYNSLDDWQDEKHFKSLAVSKGIWRNCKKVEAQYGRQARAVHIYMEQLVQLQTEGMQIVHGQSGAETFAQRLDYAAGLTGKMLGEIFVYREDEWKDELFSVGFYLGKYIYLMDAYDDLEKDAKNGQFNPWQAYLESAEEEQSREQFTKYAEEILTYMMSDCARAFERLPIVEDGDILRNILYAGVWTKFDKAKEKRNNDQ